MLDPTNGSEQLSNDHRPSLPRDAIDPVCDPAFVNAAEVDWPADGELIVGSRALSCHHRPRENQNSSMFCTNSSHSSSPTGLVTYAAAPWA
jgi:hypothetical protein